MTASPPGKPSGHGPVTDRLWSGRARGGPLTRIPHPQPAPPLPLLADRHRTGRRDLVAHIPQVFVEPVLHALLENFDGGAHRSYDAPADDALGQFQMVKSEELHALVKIDQPLGDIMEP